MRFLALKLLSVFSLCLLLSACASSVTPPARYMLPGSPMVSAPSQPLGTLQVRSPRLAHYIDVDGIVMQLNDISLNEAREHQWAESLGRQLERTLRARLSQELTTIQVIRDEGQTPNALTLLLEVDQFQGTFDGRAVARGQWQLRGPDNELLALNSFAADTELSEDGYPALVRSLAESWNSVAIQIANQIRNDGHFN